MSLRKLDTPVQVHAGNIIGRIEQLCREFGAPKNPLPDAGLSERLRAIAKQLRDELTRLIDLPDTADAKPTQNGVHINGNGHLQTKTETFGQFYVQAANAVIASSGSKGAEQERVEIEIHQPESMLKTAQETLHWLRQELADGRALVGAAGDDRIIVPPLCDQDIQLLREVVAMESKGALTFLPALEYFSQISTSHTAGLHR